MMNQLFGITVVDRNCGVVLLNTTELMHSCSSIECYSFSLITCAVKLRNGTMKIAPVFVPQKMVAENEEAQIE